jgi:hypothetical protein
MLGARVAGMCRRDGLPAWPVFLTDFGDELVVRLLLSGRSC